MGLIVTAVLLLGVLVTAVSPIREVISMTMSLVGMLVTAVSLRIVAVHVSVVVLVFPISNQCYN